MGDKYQDGKEVFLSFSKENHRNKNVVESSYYGVISDALEACFSFKEGLDTEEYKVKTELLEDASYSDAVKTAIEMEGVIKKAYTNAAILSEGLMADIPRVLKIISNKRNARINELEMMIERAIAKKG